MQPDQARHFAETWRGKRVGVIGDLMLDRYVWGEATRISQEAPIPVVVVRETTLRPGGAANVMINLAKLGAQPAAFGVIGDDGNADALERLLAAEGVALEGVIRDPTRVTTEKARILAGNQQVVRVDRETSAPLGASTAQRLGEAIRGAIHSGSVDAVIIEDYAKGVLGRELAAAIASDCAAKGIPAALDPHPGNALCTPGLSLMTPNRQEAFALAGAYHTGAIFPIENDAPLREVARRIQAQWAPAHLLVTLGAGGMALFSGDGPPLHVPTRAREVFDVSGAGDTVIASFVLALLAGAAPEEAAILANHAAGVVVGKIGTAPVTLEELIESFHEDEEERAAAPFGA